MLSLPRFFSLGLLAGWIGVIPCVKANPLVPGYDHIVVLIEENRDFSQIDDDLTLTWFQELKLQGSLLTNSFALTHPSQPNYLNLFSGYDFGIDHDDIPEGQPSPGFTTPNLAAELIAIGKTFVSYSEDLPAPGDNESDTSMTGSYQRKHNPAANWQGTGLNQFDGVTVNRPFDGPDNFPYLTQDFASLPNVSFVIPNQDHDMHDGAAVDADVWGRYYLDGYVQWAKTHNSLLIVTFDEDDFLGTNHIWTLFAGDHVKQGFLDDTHVTHYEVLRTIEDTMGLETHAGGAANVAPITAVFDVPEPGTLGMVLAMLASVGGTRRLRREA